MIGVTGVLVRGGETPTKTDTVGQSPHDDRERERERDEMPQL